MSKPKPHIVDMPADAPPEDPAEVSACTQNSSMRKRSSSESCAAICLALKVARQRWHHRHLGQESSDEERVLPHAKDPDFRPIMPIVDIELGMEKHYFAVTPDMVEPLKCDRHHRDRCHPVPDGDEQGQRCHRAGALCQR